MTPFTGGAHKVVFQTRWSPGKHDLFAHPGVPEQARGRWVWAASRSLSCTLFAPHFLRKGVSGVGREPNISLTMC